MKNINELFFEENEAFIYVKDIFEMNDLDDYMSGFHRVAICFSYETIEGVSVIKVCFGDLVDRDKLKNALDIYFNQ
jgi:hypothetical protein